MMWSSRLLVLSAVAFLGAIVSGCTFSAPQFESAIALGQGVIASNDPKSADETATWFASVDGTGAVLNPYVSNDLIVFANADGDAIAFDGWIIRSVVGFGLKEPFSMSGKDGVRTFTVAGQKMQTKCDEWRLAEFIWSQTCSNGPGEIVLDDEGNIQKITMPVFDGSAIVTLRVAK
jgi:hypothetical protein